MGDPTGDMTTQEDLRALRDYVILHERPNANVWRFVAKTAERAADRIDTLETALRDVCDYCARPVCSNIAREALEGSAAPAAPTATPPRAHSARCDCVQCQVYRILIAGELEARCQSLDEGAMPRRQRIAELEGALGEIAALENGYTYEDDHGILNDARLIARNTLLRESS